MDPNDNIGNLHKQDDFIWEKSIGKGTFGEVFQVLEKSTGKSYAIKKVF